MKMYEICVKLLLHFLTLFHRSLILDSKAKEPKYINDMHKTLIQLVVPVPYTERLPQKNTMKKKNEKNNRSYLLFHFSISYTFIIKLIKKFNMKILLL